MKMSEIQENCPLIMLAVMEMIYDNGMFTSWKKLIINPEWTTEIDCIALEQILPKYADKPTKDFLTKEQYESALEDFDENGLLVNIIQFFGSPVNELHLEIAKSYPELQPLEQLLFEMFDSEDFIIEE